jgi:hypothetical protein
MQSKTFNRIDNGFAVAGAIAFAIMLFIDLTRDNAHPSWIVFDTVMLVFCLGDVAAWLLPMGETQKLYTRALVGEAVGTTLTAAFIYFMITSTGILQLALAFAVTLGGLWLLVVSARRMREVQHVLKAAREQR